MNSTHASTSADPPSTATPVCLEELQLRIARRADALVTPRDANVSPGRDLALWRAAEVEVCALVPAQLWAMADVYCDKLL